MKTRAQTDREIRATVAQITKLMGRLSELLDGTPKTNTERQTAYIVPTPLRDAVRSTVACPRCKAPRGEYCVDRNHNQVLELHSVRWKTSGFIRPPRTTSPPPGQS